MFIRHFWQFFSIFQNTRNPKYILPVVIKMTKIISKFRYYLREIKITIGNIEAGRSYTSLYDFLRLYIKLGKKFLLVISSIIKSTEPGLEYLFCLSFSKNLKLFLYWLKYSNIICFYFHMFVLLILFHTLKILPVVMKFLEFK